MTWPQAFACFGVCMFGLGAVLALTWYMARTELSGSDITRIIEQIQKRDDNWKVGK